VVEEVEAPDAANDEDEELADEDDVEPPVAPCSAFWIPCESSVVTRLSAVWLAMLASPLDRVLWALNI
jgi:hypothetical protein